MKKVSNSLVFFVNGKKVTKIIKIKAENFFKNLMNAKKIKAFSE